MQLITNLWYIDNNVFIGLCLHNNVMLLVTNWCYINIVFLMFDYIIKSYNARLIADDKLVLNNVSIDL